MKFIVIIPARYESSRFPGKPLAKIGGEEMIVRVCRQVEKSGLPLAVATDNEEIKRVVEKAGFRAVLTASTHRSGTERVAEAHAKIGGDADVVINVQGDEPFIDPSQIIALADIFYNNRDAQIATLARVFDANQGFDALEDPNLVKLVRDPEGNALYFSRSVIPFIRKADKKEWPNLHQFLTHIGIYAYRADVLDEIVKLDETELERCESLEQLRWLENGYKITTSLSSSPTIGIDTPADLEAAEKFVKFVNK